MQAPDSRPARGTWMGPSPPLASLSGTTERAARTARLPVITSARASAVRNRDDDPCRRRRRAATCGGVENGPHHLEEGLKKRSRGRGGLDPACSPRAAALWRPRETLRHPIVPLEVPLCS